MDNPVEWAKKHPRVAMGAGVAVAAILVFAVWPRGASGGASAGTVYAGPSDAQVAAAAASAESAAQRQLAMFQIQSQADLAEAQLLFQDAAHERELQATIGMQQAQLALAMREVQRDENLAAIGANVQLAQQQTNVALGQLGVQQTAIQTQAQVQIAKTEAEASKYAAKQAKKGAQASAIGGIIGGVLGLFSERELKTDIVYLFTDKRGQRWYRYRYIGDDVTHYGVLADEVPQEYTRRVGNARVVDYQALEAAA